MNESDSEKVPDEKCGKYHNSLLTDDDIILSVSRKFSKNFKDNFQNQKWKHNVSLKLWHEVDIKKLEFFWLITNKNCGMILNPVRMVKKSNLNTWTQ